MRLGIPAEVPNTSVDEFMALIKTLLEFGIDLIEVDVQSTAYYHRKHNRLIAQKGGIK